MTKEVFLVAALGLAPWFFHIRRHDRAMHHMLSEMGSGVHILKKHDAMFAWKAPAGAFIVVPGPYEMWFWYRDHGFQKMPFYWGKRQIFRKTGAAA